MSDPLEGDIHIGKVSSASVNWRDVPFDDTDDDAELDQTPDDVIAMLGFDPKSDDDLRKFNPNHDEHGRFSSVGGIGEHRKRLYAEAVKAAVKFGYPADKVLIKDAAPEVTAGGATFKPIAQAFGDDKIHPKGSIVFYGDQFKPGDYHSVAGFMAHEVMHQKFNAVIDKAQAVGSPEHDSLTYYTSRGQLLAYEDGVSNYSRMYWGEFVKNQTQENFIRGVHETLAEMARIHAEWGSPNRVEATGVRYPIVRQGAEVSPVWKHLYNSVNTLYEQGKLK